MIRLIVFDLGNLLFRVDHSEAWEETRKHTTLDEDNLTRRFYGSGEMIENLIGELDDDDFFEQLQRSLEIQLEPNRLKSIWTGIFSPIEDRLATVFELRDHYQLGVISNISRFHSEHLERRFPVMQAFSKKTYSWACGYMKPRPEPFQAMLSESGLKPEECLFVDDQERHAEAARKLGWRAEQVALSDDLRSTLDSTLNPSCNVDR
ncbi:MAG: hypothetical protein DRP71_13575 [Verrucomicrobia bacterium]|nr:MAG: hypothetical protein DRP71_13575 [Verrucomicrobiota bacterium]